MFVGESGFVVFGMSYGMFWWYGVVRIVIW